MGDGGLLFVSLGKFCRTFSELIPHFLRTDNLKISPHLHDTTYKLIVKFNKDCKLAIFSVFMLTERDGCLLALVDRLSFCQFKHIIAMSTHMNRVCRCTLIVSYANKILK